MLRLLCLLPPVFLRREADLRLNKFAEERGVGEIIVFGYFFNGSRGIAQALLRERLFVHFRVVCINIGGEALRSAAYIILCRLAYSLMLGSSNP